MAQAGAAERDMQEYKQTYWIRMIEVNNDTRVVEYAVACCNQNFVKINLTTAGSSSAITTFQGLTYKRCIIESFAVNHISALKSTQIIFAVIIYLLSISLHVHVHEQEIQPLLPASLISSSQRSPPPPRKSCCKYMSRATFS